jgi:hypothetical protein
MGDPLARLGGLNKDGSPGAIDCVVELLAYQDDLSAAVNAHN